MTWDELRWNTSTMKYSIWKRWTTFNVVRYFVRKWPELEMGLSETFWNWGTQSIDESSISRLNYHRSGGITFTFSHFQKNQSPSESHGWWCIPTSYPIGSMYVIYGNIYHQYTPNVTIYGIHGSYGYCIPFVSLWLFTTKHRWFPPAGRWHSTLYLGCGEFEDHWLCLNS